LLKIGVSHGLLEMALWLIKHAPKEELDKVRSEEKSYQDSTWNSKAG